MDRLPQVKTKTDLGEKVVIGILLDVRIVFLASLLGECDELLGDRFIMLGRMR